MKLGFIGTGTIAKAIIDGVMASDLAVQTIYVSPRNAEIATALNIKYDSVHIAQDNQEIVDKSDYIFICTRSQITEEVLKTLSFHAHQHIISLVAMAKKSEIEDWTGHKGSVYRAVPLPFVEERKGLTPIFPESDFLKQFFDALGGALVAPAEESFALFLLGGSMMGVYYRFLEACRASLIKGGMDEKQASLYLVSIFGNLADIMRQEKIPDFKRLERDYSTQGGTNEALTDIFIEKGGAEALEEASLQVLKKIQR